MAAHLVALTSGIASFLLAAVSEINKKPSFARWLSPVVGKWLLIAGAICLLAACDGAWRDEHRNTQTVISEKALAVGLESQCVQDKRVEDAYAKGLEGLNANQRNTIDVQQQSINAQQTDVSSCVVSLGKMNPVVRREIHLIMIPFGTTDARTNRFVSQFAANKVYGSVLVITTNEDQARPSGYLRCIEPFNVITVPQLPASATMAMIGYSMPAKISDSEYRIDITNTGSHWGPSAPMYMEISSESENLTGCTFTPQ